MVKNIEKLDTPEAEPMASGTVARGRSIIVNDPSGEVVATRYVPETREPIKVLKQITFLPGQEFVAPLSEIQRLRETGFLVDPNRVYKEALRQDDFDADAATTAA